MRLLQIFISRHWIKKVITSHHQDPEGAFNIQDKELRIHNDVMLNNHLSITTPPLPLFFSLFLFLFYFLQLICGSQLLFDVEPDTTKNRDTHAYTLRKAENGQSLPLSLSLSLSLSLLPSSAKHVII